MQNSHGFKIGREASMLDKELEAAIEKLLDVGVLHANTLKTLANMADIVHGAAPTRKQTTPKKRTRSRKTSITKEALASFLKDHTGNEAAAHFGVASGTINNYKQKYGLTKKKVSKKKGKKKGK